MDGGAWRATVYGVAKSWTRLRDFSLTHCADRVGESHSFFSLQGKVPMQSPTTTKYAAESPTFGELTGVSTTKLSWISPAPWESQLCAHSISHAS